MTRYDHSLSDFQYVTIIIKYIHVLCHIELFMLLLSNSRPRYTFVGASATFAAFAVAAVTVETADASTAVVAVSIIFASATGSAAGVDAAGTTVGVVVLCCYSCYC